MLSEACTRFSADGFDLVTIQYKRVEAEGGGWWERVGFQQLCTNLMNLNLPNKIPAHAERDSFIAAWMYLAT